ncbi:MAG: MFS transporter, partial [Tardiphaga sp.]
MDRIAAGPLDESSIRYRGWRIAGVCFLLATFGWALGFYGQSVYLAELQRVHGWPATTIATATTFFYLFGALLVVFLSDAMRAFGPRNCLLAGVVAMATATALLGRITAPWQL